MTVYQLFTALCRRRMQFKRIHKLYSLAIKGFTLVEVIIVGAVMSTMFLLATQSLYSGVRSASLDQTSSGILQDMRVQQMRAMQGLVASGGATVDYSIRFEQDRYILYPGVVYDSNNAHNQVVLLDPTMKFTSITVPDQTIAFARGSGEVRGFVNGLNTVVLTDVDRNISIIIQINRIGVPVINKE